MKPGTPGAPLYFTASPLKLVLLSVFTFGYYQFYWFYRNWGAYKARTGKGLLPFWRAAFALFWSYMLFDDIHERARECRQPYVTNAGILAAAYFVLACAHVALGPLNPVSMLTVVPVLLANNLAAWVNEAAVPGYRENARFGVLNVLGILGGAIVIGCKIAFMFIDAPSLADAGLAELGVSPELIRMLK